MSKYTAEIRLLGAGLNIGENIRVVCPACGGGTTSEKSLSITLGDNGKLMWNCFRDKCCLTPATIYSPSLRTRVPLQIDKKSRTVFQGNTEPLREQHLEWIFKKWGIKQPPHWYYTPELGGRIAMSVRSPKFLHRGWCMRAIRPDERTKVLTYIDEGEEGLSWYKTSPTAPIVVVEDIPSAVRASKYVNSVALLGTGIGLSRALELSETTARPVVLALDQDATAASFKWARKYSLLWDDVQVLPLKQDLKDMKEEELCTLLTNL